MAYRFTFIAEGICKTSVLLDHVFHSVLPGSPDTLIMLCYLPKKVKNFLGPVMHIKCERYVCQN